MNLVLVNDAVLTAVVLIGVTVNQSGCLGSRPTFQPSTFKCEQALEPACMGRETIQSYGTRELCSSTR
jgi:hypothetical protein